jgi:hypothetical protein
MLHFTCRPGLAWQRRRVAICAYRSWVPPTSSLCVDNCARQARGWRYDVHVERVSATSIPSLKRVTSLRMCC